MKHAGDPTKTGENARKHSSIFAPVRMT